MERFVQGVVHGKTIELREDIGVADGQTVELCVRVAPSTGQWGDGLRESAGGWADFPEMDAIMEQIQRQRKIERPSQTNDDLSA